MLWARTYYLSSSAMLCARDLVADLNSQINTASSSQHPDHHNPHQFHLNLIKFGMWGTCMLGQVRRTRIAMSPLTNKQRNKAKSNKSFNIIIIIQTIKTSYCINSLKLIVPLFSKMDDY